MANVFDLLDKEWLHLRGDRAAARRLGPVCRLAGGVPDLGALEDHVRAADPAAADRVLLALVTRVVDHGDQLAARVLLQLLLPGTRNLARRWWAFGGPDERAAAAVGAVYDRICTYPLARRPGRVAANVLMDASRAMRRALPRLATEPSSDPLALRGSRQPEPPRHPGDELVEILCRAVSDGVIAPSEAELIGRTRVGGDCLATLSRRRGIPERTLFAHRQRAERALAASYAAGC